MRGRAQYQLRPVTTADLLAARAGRGRRGPGAAALALPEVQPAPERRALSSPMVLEQFEQLNAAAELSCTIACPAARAQDVLDLDIARFLWTEVRRAASRLLGEIHTLASAYGWSEQAITPMSAGRRAAYLEMLGG